MTTFVATPSSGSPTKCVIDLLERACGIDFATAKDEIDVFTIRGVEIRGGGQGAPDSHEGHRSSQRSYRCGAGVSPASPSSRAEPFLRHPERAEPSATTSSSRARAASAPSRGTSCHPRARAASARVEGPPDSPSAAIRGRCHGGLREGGWLAYGHWLMRVSHDARRASVILRRAPSFEQSLT